MPKQGPSMKGKGNPKGTVEATKGVIKQARKRRGSALADIMSAGRRSMGVKDKK